MKTLIIITTSSSSSQEEESKIDTCYLHIPRVIKPKNDYPYLETKANCEIDTFRIMLFKRWGEIFFESNDINKHWITKEAKIGVYV